MVKIVHMSSVHPVSDVRIFHKESRALAQAGYEVTLIARGERDDVTEDVQIRSVQSSVENRVKRMTKTVIDVMRLAIAEDGVLYHFHDPELIPVGFALKARGKRVVYDVHENVPKDILSKSWIPRPMRRLVSVVVSGLLGLSSWVLDAIVVATPGIAEAFPENRTTLVQNYPLLAELSGTDNPDTTDRPTDLVYTGGISELRGIWQMVKALEYLNDARSVRLKLGGRFMPRSLEEELIHQPGWAYVDMMGWLGRREVTALYGRVRVGLVLFQPAPNHIESQPNKLFEYMAAGLPVVASDFPLWRKLVTDLECGLVVDPSNPRAIADAVQWLFDHPEEAQAMGQRGRKAVLEQYNWEAESGKLLALYESLIGPPKAPMV